VARFDQSVTHHALHAALARRRIAKLRVECREGESGRVVGCRVEAGIEAAMLQSARTVGLYVLERHVVDVIGWHMAAGAGAVEQRPRPRDHLTAIAQIES